MSEVDGRVETLQEILHRTNGERDAYRRQRDEARAEADRLREQVERLHSWVGLMELMDEHWPEDVWPTRSDDLAMDAGHRIVSLLRVVDRLRATLAEVGELHADDGEGWCVSCSTGAPCSTARTLSATDPVSLADVRANAGADMLDAICDEADDEGSEEILVEYLRGRARLRRSIIGTEAVTDRG